MPPVKGPIPDTQLIPPLNATQRGAIIAWLRSLNYGDDIIWAHIVPTDIRILIHESGLGPTVDVQAYITGGNKYVIVDAYAIAVYKSVEAGEILSRANPATDTTFYVPGTDTLKSAAQAAVAIVSALLNPNTWVRIGEFAVGAVLLTVGVSAMVRQATK